MKSVIYYALGVIAVGVVGYWAGSVNTRISYEVTIAKMEQGQRSAIEYAKKRNDALIDKIQELEEDAAKAKELHDAAVVAADSAADGLRKELSRVRRAAQASEAAGVCIAAQSTIGVLTDMLGELDEAAGAYAKQADEARAAGLMCQSVYEKARD